MDRQILILTIAALAAVFIGVAWLTRKREAWSVYEFFLAGRNLRQGFVTNLLVSGSFSLNGMLYQIYLGYKIGAWAIVTQLAWAASFVLLARYADRISSSNGLHDFVGKAFSTKTRQLAAICSVLGLSLQLGWEYNVTKSAFSSITDPPMADSSLAIVALSIFGIATVYTMLGGLRSNSVTDTMQNIVKGACFAALGVLAYSAVAGASAIEGTWSAFPPFSAAIAELTIIGFMTNVAFSLAWQFVDMSTWQTAIATSAGEGGAERVRSALRRAGFWVLVAPGALGTFIGIALSAQPGLEANQLLPALIGHTDSGFLLVVLAVALIATAMSFADGMMLGAGYTFITDLLYRRAVDTHRLLHRPTDAQLEDVAYQEAAARVISGSRVAVVAAALLGTVVLEYASRGLGLNLFEQVYLVTVSQLALAGPVVAALRGRKGRPGGGRWSIGIALLLGFGCIGIGSYEGFGYLTTLAPIIAVGTSLVLAQLFSVSNANLFKGGPAA